MQKIAKIGVVSFLMQGFLLYSAVESPSKFEVSFEQSMGMKRDINDTAGYSTKRQASTVEECRENMNFLKNLYQKNHMSKVTPGELPIIPKIIHQIWIGPKAPPAILKTSQESIQKFHPDWEYKLWTDADVPGLALFNKRFYDESDNWGEKSDILRYEILKRYGGVYMDVDVICTKPFDILNHTYEFYASLDPLITAAFLSNAIIGSVPEHPILNHCIGSISHTWEVNKKRDLLWRVFYRTGPILFSHSFFKITKEYTGNRIIAFPTSFFFPTVLQTFKKPTLQDIVEKHTHQKLLLPIYGSIRGLSNVGFLFLKIF